MIRKGIVAISFLFLLIAAATAQESISVDLELPLGPATARGSGFLGGFSGSTLPDSLLAPVKPRLLRFCKDEIIATYSRCSALGTTMEVNTSCGWSGVPGGGGNWVPWENQIKGVVKDIRDRQMTNVQFAVWNDPDMAYSWSGSDDTYFETFKHAFQAIRSVDGAALVVGPNSTWGPVSDNGSAHPNDDTWWVRKFLNYCILNKCVPDVIAFHDYSEDGTHIENDVAVVRKMLADNSVPAKEIEEDDLGVYMDYFRPGSYVSYFAAIERAKVYRTAKCCWNNDYGNNTLEGLLTPDRTKRSLWHAYRAYSRIVGTIVNVVRSTSFDAVAGVDPAGATLRILVGRYKSGTGNIAISCNGFFPVGSSVHVQAEHIPNSGSNPLTATSIAFEQDISVSNRKATISIDNFAGYDAYLLTITGLAQPQTKISWKPFIPPAAAEPTFVFGGNMVRIAGLHDGATCALRIIDLRSVLRFQRTIMKDEPVSLDALTPGRYVLVIRPTGENWGPIIRTLFVAGTGHVDR
jgi:hypothetical protein